MTVRKVACFASVVMLCFATLAGCRRWLPGNVPRAPRVQEIRLGEMAAEEQRGWWLGEKASRDGLHLAWVVRANEGFAVAIDGKAGPRFGQIGGILNLVDDVGWEVCAEFSDDGHHVAYSGRRGKAWYAVIDGQIGPACDEVRLGENRVFGPRGSHYAYVARRGHKDTIIIDGQEGRAYDRTSTPRLSPEGSRVAYIAANAGEGEVVVLDGQPVGQAEEINPYSLTFSPDGRRFAYATKRPEKPVIVDGETYPLVGEIALSHLIFSPDSQHLAYVEYTGSDDGPDECWLVLDGERGRPYRSIGMPSFVPGSGQVCYAAMKGEWRDEVIVVGEEESPTYDQVHPAPVWYASHGCWFGPAMQFSADGRRSAYCATLADEEFVVVDGRQGPPFRTVCPPVFSPDGRSLAYWAEVGARGWAVVVDGKPGTHWHSYRLHPVFSPDSRRLAYVARRFAGAMQSQDVVVVDGRAGPPCELVSMPSFSADSKHYAYLARTGDREWMVVDGKEGPKYDEIFTGEGWDAPVPFQPDGRLEYIARRGDRIYRVKEFPPGRGQ